MNEFGQDVIDHVEKYYYNLIEVTPKIGLAVLAFLISWFIASRAQRFTGHKLKKRMHDPLLAVFISRLIKASLVIVGLFIVLRIVGLTGIASSLLAGAGISAFVIGFALKDIGENFLAGILLAFKRPFHIGEIIESEGLKGKVISLNLRDTQILSNGRNIYIPNSFLVNNPLTNYSRQNLLLQEIIVGVEYGADYERAIEIISEVINKTEGILNTDDQSSYVIVSGLSTNTVDIDIGYWVRTVGDISYSDIKSKVIINILKALEDEGFNLPANVVEIKKYENDVYKKKPNPQVDGPHAIEKGE
ncbi:MAG TPA: mechanosensitive ion channel family protein [Flavobacterium sp.]|jgi:small-conductance mechanosensitive channel